MSTAEHFEAGEGIRSMLSRAFSNLFAFLVTLRRVPRMPSPAWPPRRHMLIGTLALFMVLLATMLLFDVPAVTAARRLPHGLVQAFNDFTDLGKSGWFLFPAGGVLIAAAVVMSPRLPRFSQLVLATIAVRAGFIFVAIGLPGIFVNILKRLIGRARPFVGGGADAFLYHPFNWSAAYQSLPSGHGATAFGAAIAIGSLWPCTRLVMWIYAALIAVSRVVVTAHHPSDVIAGAVVGIVGALLVRHWFAARRLGFIVTPKGMVRPLPGPSLRRVKAVAHCAFRA